MGLGAGTRTSFAVARDGAEAISRGTIDPRRGRDRRPGSWRSVDAHLFEGDAPGDGDLGPGALAESEWRAAGLALPDSDRLRSDRLARLRSVLRDNDCSAALLTDPINVRYATDSTNMSLSTMHNAVRYAFVATSGPVILFDFHGGEHLSAHLPLVEEVRPGRGWFYFNSGEHTVAVAELWAREVAELVRLHSGGAVRLAVDKVEPAGVRALEALGVEIVDGQEVCETARLIKTPDELAAMRCAIAATENSMTVMQQALRPGVTEQELWSHLHAENIKRGGEWIETRLLAAGQRTNPWFSECSSQVILAGDLVAFDTDLIGPYGYCCDISRTWICDAEPTSRQRDLYQVAVAQIAHNAALLRPGLTFFDFAARAFDLPAQFRANRYSTVMHGVGLCDEYPAIPYPEDAETAYDGVLQANMTVCLESYVGEAGGPDGVKLEEQFLITETGSERLSNYPLEPAFL